MLIYDYSKTLKFKRGQVWMVTEPESVSNAKASAHVGTICFTRPYVIMSADEVCAKEVILQGYPLTHSTGRPDGGIIFNEPAPSTEKSLILINQLTPIEVKNMIQYMYTLSEDLMKKIDKLTAERMGIETIDEKTRWMNNRIRELEKELISRPVLENTAERYPRASSGFRVGPINAYAGESEEQGESKKPLSLKSATNDECENKKSTKPTENSFKSRTTVVIDPQYQLISYAKRVNHPEIRSQKKLPNNKIKLNINSYANIFKTAMEEKAFSENELKCCGEWIAERSPKVKRQRHKWTPDLKQEFLKLLDSDGIAAVSEKFGLKPNSVRRMAYIFREDIANISCGDIIAPATI